MIELNILKNNKTGLIIMGCCLICPVFAYILLIGVDGHLPNEVSIAMLQYGVYVVYTQFGFFLFTAIPMYLVTSDYKEKTVVFYKKMNYTAVTYVIRKVLSICMFLAIGSFLVVAMIAIYYMSVDNALLLFLKLINLSFFYVEFAVFLAFFLGNFIKAFAGGFFVWTGAMILINTNPHGLLRFFAYYDSTLDRHYDFFIILSNQAEYISVLYELAYNTVVSIGIVALVVLFKKRWVQYGV